MRRLVVVGNGMAGARTVEEILDRGGGERFAITMIGEEPHGNYNRISLSNVLAGEEDPREIFLNPLDWYEEHGITLHAGVRATKLDTFAKAVRLADGTRVPYDVLLLATGSRSYIPPIDGLRNGGGELKDGVFGFRTMEDTDRMLAWAEEAGSAAVIGGGLLGLEAARGLSGRGLHVEVVHRSARLMNLQLDQTAAGILRTAVERLGIRVRLETATARATGNGRVTGLEFEDGSATDCDMVVVTAGIRPNVELAAAAGLSVERGIVVDDAMRSVDDDQVYAVGECAQHRGAMYGLVAPLWEQATVVADRLAGGDEHAAYHGSKLATKLKVSGIELATMGICEPEHPDDEVVRFAEPKRGVYKTVIVREGRLVGAILLGDTSKVSFLTQAFDRGTVLPEERVGLLFDLGGPPESASIEELPDDAQVCNCNGVSKGKLVACVAGGKRSVKEVMDATRAGKGCGSCKQQVAQIVELAAGGELDEDPTADYYLPCIPLAKPDLIAAVRSQDLRSVSAVFATLAPDGPDPAAKPALASLLKMVWSGDYDDERDAKFINDRVHANIQKDGTFSVVPRMAGGVTTAAELKRIAEVAERYEIPMIKVTGGQRIDLLGVAKEKLPDVWRDLGMRSGYAYGKTFRTVKTCVGSDFCRFGLGDSTKLGIDIEERFKGLEAPAKLKLAVAGCPRNCSEAMVKDVGVVAVEGARWQVYVGGAAGAHVRKGDLLCTLDSPEAVLAVTGRFIQHYREHAKWLERTYTFMERMGVERVRAAVVDCSEEEAARLDTEMEATIAAYRDPWLEADEPRTVNQFTSAIS